VPDLLVDVPDSLEEFLVCGSEQLEVENVQPTQAHKLEPMVDLITLAYPGLQLSEVVTDVDLELLHEGRVLTDKHLPTVKHLLHAVLQHSMYTCVKQLIHTVLQHIMYTCVQHLLHAVLQHIMYTCVKHLLHAVLQHIMYTCVKHLLHAVLQHIMYTCVQHLLHAVLQHIMYTCVKQLLHTVLQHIMYYYYFFNKSNCMYRVHFSLLIINIMRRLL